MTEPTTVVLKLTNGKSFSYITMDERYVSAVKNAAKSNKANSTFTYVDLQKAAARNGGKDAGVLEYEDLTPKEVIEYAKLLGFEKFYDIKLSKDGKFFEITIKKTSWLTSDPNLHRIKKDFGIADNVFVTSNGIPYGNEEVIKEAPDKNPDGRMTNYDNATIETGKTLRIPVDEVHLDGSKPRNGLSRLIN